MLQLKVMPDDLKGSVQYPVFGTTWIASECGDNLGLQKFLCRTITIRFALNNLTRALSIETAM